MSLLARVCFLGLLLNACMRNALCEAVSDTLPLAALFCALLLSAVWCWLLQVLDMCAAPGSKTFQLLEMIHDIDGSATGSGANAGSSQLTPTGFVVANDADAQRCNLLTHQTKRMCSPCLMVTNHEAQAFPRIRASLLDKPAPGSKAAAAAAMEAAVQPDAAGDKASNGPVTGRVHKDDTMLFDRILADVPCSGDGTMRKAPDIWRRWSVNNGNGLHNLQLRIALQAARLLKVCAGAGRMRGLYLLLLLC